MWLSGHKFNFRRQDMKIEWIVGKKLATFVANVMLNLNLSKIIEVVDVKKKKKELFKLCYGYYKILVMSWSWTVVMETNSLMFLYPWTFKT